MSKTVVRNRKNIWNRAASNKTASSRPVFSRLLGLETEYGLYLDKQVSVTSLSSNTDETAESDREFASNSDVTHVDDATTTYDQWYSKLLDNLASKGPLVPSRSDSKTFFIANGGCVSYETSSCDARVRGLLEGATPECTSPLTLLSYQTAQDELLSEATQDAFGKANAKLIKNSADASGHLYGQQENYEVEIAHGWRLLAWRFGLLALLPLVLLYKVGSWSLFAFVFAGSFLSEQLQKYIAKNDPNEEEKYSKFEAKYSKDPADRLSPRWVRFSVQAMRWLHAPLAVALHGLIYAFVLIPHRRQMMAFLATRPCFDGVGYFDASGRYWLGAKAASVTTVIGFGNYWGERPIFVTGHWLQAICTDPWHSLEGWRKLFQRRQRIQISIGDATPNPSVEYLRVGVTDLVLDMVESRFEVPLPDLQQPLAAFHRFAGDWMLLHRSPNKRQQPLNAIEIQREYIQAARRFLHHHWQVPDEAWDVLHRWQTTIDQLAESRTDPNSQRWLLGRVDWISKKWLLDQVDPSAEWSVRKKVDMRFHELSTEGYHTKLQQALNLPLLLDAMDVDRARRMPPQGTPATQRGYFIREFASVEEPIRVDWESVEIGEGRERRIVPLRKPR